MALNTDQPILSRNIEILKKFLGREMPSDIAKEFNFYSKASVSQCSKAAIEALNRHTDCDFPVTASYEILGKLEKDILKAIEETKLPKVNINYRVHLYLAKEFGKGYPSKAKEIAKLWNEKVGLHFSTFNENRERNNLLAWLASEGYFVGDYLTVENKRDIGTMLADHLKGLELTKGKQTLKIEDSDHWYDDSRIIEVEYHNTKKQVAKRRIKLSIITL